MSNQNEKLKLKKFLQIITLQIGQKKSLQLKNVNHTVPCTNAIEDLNDQEAVGTFDEKELQNTNQTALKIEKLIKKECDKLHAKWKGYHTSFNGRIDVKYIIIEK